MDAAAPGVIAPSWLFATPLWRPEVSGDLRAALPLIAKAVEVDWQSGQIGSNYNRSNFLGGQSQRALLRDCRYLDEGARLSLLETIRSAVVLAPRFQIIAWINCGLASAHNTAHVHPGAELSGVLYVQVPEGSGSIIFRDPRPQSEMSQLGQKLGGSGHALRPRYEIQPKAGDLLIFPSWLMHQVEPGKNRDELRIALAFNINGLAQV